MDLSRGLICVPDRKRPFKRPVHSCECFANGDNCAGGAVLMVLLVVVVMLMVINGGQLLLS